MTLKRVVLAAVAFAFAVPAAFVDMSYLPQ